MRHLTSRILGVAIALFAAGAAAQQPAQFILGVSEGSATDVNHLGAQAKYRAIADAITQATRVPVVVQERARMSDIAAGTQKGAFDFVAIRPADIAARAMRDHKYRYVASAKPDSHCFIGVTKDSPIQKLDDIKGKRIATLRAKNAYLRNFCAAELRDQGIRLADQRLIEVDLQGAVPVAVESGMADVALLEVNTAKGWQAKGHRIVHTSRPQPFFPLIAGPRVSTEQIEAVRKALQAAGNAAGGQNPFKALGVTGVDVSTEKNMRELLPWLEGK